jgi:hypothetical protein
MISPAPLLWKSIRCSEHWLQTGHTSFPHSLAAISISPLYQWKEILWNGNEWTWIQICSDASESIDISDAAAPPGKALVFYPGNSMVTVIFPLQCHILARTRQTVISARIAINPFCYRRQSVTSKRANSRKMIQSQLKLQRTNNRYPFALSFVFPTISQQPDIKSETLSQFLITRLPIQLSRFTLSIEFNSFGNNS